MRISRISSFIACSLCVVLLAVCVAPLAALSANQPLEPEAGKWTTWLLSSPAAVRPAPPPDALATRAEIAQLKELAAARDADTAALVAYWDAGSPSYRWISLALAQHAAAHIPPGPLYSRGMALLNVAVYDAMVAAWDAKYTYNRLRPSQVDGAVTTMLDVPNSPSYPSEHAVAAGAASTILAYLFPDNAALFAEQAQQAARSRLLAGVQYLSDVEAGLALGRAVADQVIAYAKTDGADAVWDGAMPTAPGHWTGKNPVAPMAGTWKPWVLASGSELRPPAPPAADSEQLHAELTALETYTPTFATTAAAYFWQSPAGTLPYIYNNTARLLFENRLDQNPPQAARIYAAVAVAQHDAFVACYDAKYTYWSMRPSQLDPDFKPLFPNPNFPSYPSAHGCGSGAVARVLANYFPADAKTLMANAKEAGDSRLWAGIHFQSDVDAGLDLGVKVGDRVLERMRQTRQPDKAPQRFRAVVAL